MNDKVSRLTDYILRGIFGLVFMFSGFVKAVDPMGTAYKVEEYLNVFGFGFMLNDALTLPIIIAVFLCVMEFTIGVTMFLHIYKACSLGCLVVYAFLYNNDIDRRTDK